MERSGFSTGHEIDRVAAPDEVSVVECARILSFFDRDGTATLNYSEFMRLLQASGGFTPR